MSMGPLSGPTSMPLGQKKGSSGRSVRRSPGGFRTKVPRRAQGNGQLLTLVRGYAALLSRSRAGSIMERPFKLSCRLSL